MAELVNPRRAPRAPARCRAAVVFPHGRFEAETEDIGSLGCQIVSPKLVRKGDPVQLLITHGEIEEPLQAAGRVVWVSAQPPWRAGIAFDDGCLVATARWFDRLVSVHPLPCGFGRVPARIATDRTVYLGPPPRFLVDFTRDEATLLRSIASGARVDELMARLRADWPAAQRALFSLIARGAVTFQRGHAVRPDAWKKILSDVEASLAVESLGKGGVAAPVEPERLATPPPVPVPRPSATPLPRPPTGAAPGAAWMGGAPYDSTRVVDLEDDGPSLDVAGPADARGRKPHGG